MKVLDPGHAYLLDALDVEPTQRFWFDPQTLMFVKRIGERYPGNTGKPHPGVTMQEMLRVIIDRLEYVNRQIPAEENGFALFHLQSAFWWMESRAAAVRGVVLSRGPRGIERVPACAECGHVFCSGGCR